MHVELVAPREGRRRYTGVLTHADEDGFELNVDGSAVPIRYAEAGRTRLAPDWSKPAPRGRKR